MDAEINTAVKRLKRIAGAPKITFEDTKVLFDTLNQYFDEFERSRKFRGLENRLCGRFSEFLVYLNRDPGTYFADLFFQFCYTLTQDYKIIQETIYTNVALPYQNWVNDKWQAFIPAVKDITRGNEYVFVCRHAVTTGPYAPGSSVFTYANALLGADRKVTVISLGDVGQQFGELAKKHPHLKIYTVKQMHPTERFSALVELLKLIQPTAIMTEIEFDIVSVLSILKPELPTIFFSPGFYKIPWFDKIGLTDSLDLSNGSGVCSVNSNRFSFFEIPTYVSNKVLAPPVDKTEISNVRHHLGLNEKDFVIGSFARMEKFQNPFLKVIKNVLDECPTVKVVLAGPNDRAPIESALRKYIGLGRVVVLPVSNVHVLGHCVNLGIDTFPTHSGFSVLELMAKGVPVVAKKGANNHINLRQRVPELVCEDDFSLVRLICNLAKNPSEIDRFRKLSKELVASNYNDVRFISALDQSIAEL